ncbi:MAG TPA: VWA domain-containing protein, partial [Epsilonproteobacteria bacterium]|nr:VWA domain-containing protein [Campylobacterota bacterium]
MTLLYPSFLWLLVPLTLFFFKSSPKIVVRTHLVILMLLLFSLARPVKEASLQESNIQARDLIIALDVSYSMRASDIPPTRYTFAKETIKQLLKNNPTDNVMLMAFTSNPLLLSPPTTDHTLIDVALDALNPEFILTKGTSLKKLFKKLAH